MNNRFCGVGAMIAVAAHLSERFDLEILSCGREGLARHDCLLEMTGKFLSYDVILDHTFVFLKVAMMDEGTEPELLLSVPDNRKGWEDIAATISALEKHQIKALSPRPLEIGNEIVIA